jgi:hypothetical protein
MKQTIKRVQALREMEIKETPDGKQIVFSILFASKSGEAIFHHRAVAAGLRFNMKINRYRGIAPVDENFNRTSHVTPVHIDNILEFNGKTVQL